MGIFPGYAIITGIMEETPLVHLELCAPLEYAEMPPVLGFAFNGSNPEGRPCGEWLFCFEIDQEQGTRIDPRPDRFLGGLVFSGRNTQIPEGTAPGKVQLPASLYLFTQRRRELGRKECIDLAMDQQKDGLWERLQFENRLYIRFLFEDGSPVTQFFRPVIS